ncbi:MAG: hypothetical protein HOP12_02060, partial [Candidatus Eisenbacteria bacterium]|nr:hypothetical protein [Candidatus Eisenbacteria bacterium]
MRIWIILLVVLESAIAACPVAGHGDTVHTLRLANGEWFDGHAFVRRDFYSVEGALRNHWSGAVEETLDLSGRFVVPAFADAHSHLFSDTAGFAADLERDLRAGVLFVKNPNNPTSLVSAMRKRVNQARTVDVVYANGGLTAGNGHPAQIYDGATATASPRWIDDAYFTIDDRKQLELKWPRVVAGRPDFIKVYLEHSEAHAARSHDPTRRGGFGLDPALLPTIVRRAHGAGLTVSAHVASAADFRVAMTSGVDEITHLPLERLA